MRKTLETALQASLRKTLRSPELGENLEDRHWELECQRAARQCVERNPVLGENLEDLHCQKPHALELECQ